MRHQVQCSFPKHFFTNNSFLQIMNDKISLGVFFYLQLDLHNNTYQLRRTTPPYIV